MTAIDDTPGVSDEKRQGDDFARLLRLLGYGDSDRIVLCGDHSGEFVSRHVTGVVAAAAAATSEPMTLGNVWFGVNPISPEVIEGRGKVADVLGLLALFADLDFKDSGVHDEATATAV